LNRCLASAALVVLLDQVSKALIRSQLALGETIPVLGDLVRLRYVHNAGAAFGLFQGSRIFFIIVSLLSVAVVIYLIVTGRYRFRGSRIAFGLVMGGAIGNLIDRVWMKEVVDFIDVGIGYYRWPTFNVADIGLTLGVLYLAASFMAAEWGGRGADSEPEEGR